MRHSVPATTDELRMMRIAARAGLRGFAMCVFGMTVLRAALVMSNVVSRAEARCVNTPVRVLS